jgi:hypothetical protein
MRSPEYNKGFTDALQWVLNNFCHQEINSTARKKIEQFKKEVREQTRKDTQTLDARAQTI